MKKKLSAGWIVLIVIAALLVIAIIAAVGTYNGLAQKREAVSAAESDIGVQLQRRANLIPNLISTVKVYMEHETEVIDAVTEARAKMTGADSTADKLQADEELSSALSRLLVVVENYPDLKSNQNFIQLQDELAGTENRITASRKDYNEKAQTYNSSIITFPANIFAGIFGFEKAEYFQADEGAQTVPDAGELFNS